MPKFKNPRVPSDLRMRLISRRLALSLSQQNVAVQLGLCRTTYTQYETGASKLTLRRVAQIAKILACCPGWLAFGEGVAPGQVAPSAVVIQFDAGKRAAGASRLA